MIKWGARTKMKAGGNQILMMLSYLRNAGIVLLDWIIHWNKQFCSFSFGENGVVEKHGMSSCLIKFKRAAVNQTGQKHTALILNEP